MPRRFGSWLGAFGLASALSLSLNPCAASIAVDVQRDGDSYVVHAGATVAADPRVAWDTLTDYEHLPDFVPDIDESRVVSREGNRLVVEHVGAFHLMLISMPVRVRLAVRHEPYERVLARTEPGKVGTEEPTLASMTAQYRLTPLAGPQGGIRVDYDARFRLVESMPEFVDSLFGRAIVAHGIRRHFAAMMSEIERRQRIVAGPVEKR